ncbi:MAG: hypothetical protein A3H52_01495 [Candidatus Zambryskibacteria bacterium RIFCSPLOWO2_02_FULL_39_26]|uniref:Uncharacterized protein n=1 Tax=Candidatus Zambryskibacteria bacterium RIFCSPLOWO2_12_FULL_39_23 TaxID=1802776 RepID=A0A1G2URI8_9BACT|nr:MAG: hypothetical protein A2W51_00960 [Candidatus Zambryskibacteria bacterium RIFCSPHIGHO2_02_39_10]OHA99296.1 MAG: hypothetical protein A3E59_00245 [Candidatus Zambryskibacteria bacterium RIFCSPHIGHO2_12_FULL_39_47]OHB10425.1 MAG: hypothetical protein A3H52_01495 [Candidatus Zambryskibacteria bacterium RIFCSPLOWO2_02_FULL_39_26]OHB11996.1 MAG: hypothetical protein A3G99_02840 [Candidatus Zambryskibacteria bacterium RIFCSPLOWO2_12_FULL_39_23]
MKTRDIIVLFLIAFVLFISYGASKDANTQNLVFCPADAKICPDGSSVGRTGPDCQFTECPN